MIETKRLLLREITINDAKDIFLWTNDPRVNENVIYPLNKDISEVINWIKSIKKEDGEYLIVEKSSNKPIGTCSLAYSKEFGEFMAGINLAHEAWSKGYGTEATSALFDYAKNKLHINKVIARVFKRNEASLKMCKKNGFVIEKEIFFKKIGVKTPIPCYLLAKTL